MSTALESRATPRRGIALPIALAAIIAVGALIAGVFFASTQEYRVGRNTLAAQRAMHGAEIGLSSVVSAWTGQVADTVDVGRTIALADTVIDGATVKRQFTRISPTVFWVTATAEAGKTAIEGRAIKRLNTIIRIETPDFRIMGAATVRNKVTSTGSLAISGNDTTPPGWDCPPAGPPAAGIVVNDSATYASSGGSCSGYSCVIGSPKVKDSTAVAKDTMTYKQFGGFSYDSLVKVANKVLDAGKVPNNLGPKFLGDGSCDRAHVDNWGAIDHVAPPAAPGKCDDYFPIVHLKGDQDWTLNGGGGQGIILADGSLKINGKFTWRGIIIVKGVVKTNGTADGVKILGALMVMNQGNTEESTFSGNSSIQFSRCVINQVTSRIATAAPMRDRAWADLSF